MLKFRVNNINDNNNTGQSRRNILIINLTIVVTFTFNINCYNKSDKVDRCCAISTDHDKYHDHFISKSWELPKINRNGYIQDGIYEDYGYHVYFSGNDEIAVFDTAGKRLNYNELNNIDTVPRVYIYFYKNIKINKVYEIIIRLPVAKGYYFFVRDNDFDVYFYEMFDYYKLINRTIIYDNAVDINIEEYFNEHLLTNKSGNKIVIRYNKEDYFYKLLNVIMNCKNEWSTDCDREINLRAINVVLNLIRDCRKVDFMKKCIYVLNKISNYSSKDVEDKLSGIDKWKLKMINEEY